MNAFERFFSEQLAAALSQLDPEGNWSPGAVLALIETPPQPDWGDYAFPCFTLAKRLRKGPPLIAQDLAQALQGRLAQDWESVRAVGPYLNLTLKGPALARNVLPAVFSGDTFREPSRNLRERVMIEFSQPNTHKGFHVGHLRNVALGDALVRIYRYNGYDVVGANYIGDVGTHIAKCLWHYRYTGQAPPDSGRGEWLGALYTEATLRLEDAAPEDAAGFQKEIGSVLSQLEAGDPEVTALWEETRKWSMDEFDEIYRWLDVHFDRVFCESEVDEEGKRLVLEGEREGHFVRSEGAIGIDLEEEGLGFFLLLKSDGNTLYSTKDLALAKRKFEEFGVERSIYVVGMEQTLHFKQVFATLEHMGYSQAQKCYHLPYALVMLPSGKMSSRAGNVILFSQLREQMLRFLKEGHLQERQREWSVEEVGETAKRMAIAAIKYGMLSQDPNKQIIFSLEEWLRAEGDTGVYLTYAYVRIRSIVRQVGEPSSSVDFELLEHPNEKLLLRHLLDFNQVVWNAGEQFKPSLLAHALFEMAKDFSRAYNTCPVKHAETPDLREARLLLFHCVAEALRQGLTLLGITPPERM
jgi:arginyl-tRNA synthetase